MRTTASNWRFQSIATGSALLICASVNAFAGFVANDLVVSRIQYDGNTFGNTGTYPTIFSDPAVSGVQGSVHLDQFSIVPGSPLANSLALTGITSSFSSKSEGAVMRSVDGHVLSYTGYIAPVGAGSVSNSYTTGANIPGNTAALFDRGVALINADGAMSATPQTNSYSGDNPRAAVSINGGQFFTVGNSDSTQPAGNTIGARYGTPGSNVSTQLGFFTAPSIPNQKPSNLVKDNNWRGIGIYNGNLYVSKGSGGNGINGIFQVGSGLSGNPGQDITELPGFPTTPAASTTYFPFGFFFANPNTLYVADEGPGSLAADPIAGLEKWVLTGGMWQLAYTVQNGLNLDGAQTLAGYPVPTYTTGLRNLAGQVNPDGTVSIYAITAQYSSISGGEPDPTQLVAVSDPIAATSLSSSEAFTLLQTSPAGSVYRGVSLAPTPAPEPSTLLLFCGGVAAVAFFRRKATGRCAC